MNDDLRRTDDRRIAALELSVNLIGTRVALVEQAQNNVRDALQTVQTGQDRIMVKLDGMDARASEPSATPAGRQLERASAGNAAAIRELRTDVDSLDEFRAEVRGTLKALKALVAAAAFLASISGAAEFIHFLANGGQP